MTICRGKPTRPPPSATCTVSTVSPEGNAISLPSTLRVQYWVVLPLHICDVGPQTKLRLPLRSNVHADDPVTSAVA